MRVAQLEIKDYLNFSLVFDFLFSVYIYIWFNSPSLTCLIYHKTHFTFHVSYFACHIFFFTNWVRESVEGLLSTGLPNLGLDIDGTMEGHFLYIFTLFQGVFLKLLQDRLLERIHKNS